MKWRWIILSLLAVLMIGGAVAWVRYPKPPDIRRMSIDDALAFMAGDGFNQLRASQRKAFAIATAEKMHEKSFGDILWMMSRPDPQRQQRFANLRALAAADREDVGAAYMRVFLDRFYVEPPLKRKVYLTTFAGLQQTEISKHPEQFGLPNADQFKNDLGRFVSHQPPKVQAQMGQFLIDLKKQRDALGLKDPF
jgi:hypothetical protein